jgi:polyhydroxybutyrate depolymerase
MQPIPAGSGPTIALSHDGRDRPYLLYEPLVIPAEPAPLVIQLHGRGGGGSWFDRLLGLIPVCAKGGVWLAIPNAVNGTWNDGRDETGRLSGDVDDVGYLAALLDDVAARQAIDPDRIFVVGMSNGGAMAGRLACELGDRVTAIAQVSGTAARAAAAAGAPARPISIINFHGTADPVAPYAGGTASGFLARLLFMGRPRASSLGVDAWAEHWVLADRAETQPVEEGIGTDVYVRTWHAPGADIAFYRIDGGGHTWPGSGWPGPAFLFGRTTTTIDATSLIWQFFASHGR